MCRSGLSLSHTVGIQTCTLAVPTSILLRPRRETEGQTASLKRVQGSLPCRTPGSSRSLMSRPLFKEKGRMSMMSLLTCQECMKNIEQTCSMGSFNFKKHGLGGTCSLSFLFLSQMHSKSVHTYRGGKSDHRAMVAGMQGIAGPFLRFREKDDRID